MNKPIRSCSLAIVGCGIEGSILAFLAGQSTMFEKIFAFDAPGTLNLGPDSLRSQAILHSGLQYGERNRVSALRMRYSGVMMHESLGLPIPDSWGVIRCDIDYDLISAAKQLRLDHLVDQLSEREAEETLGVFYKSGYRHFKVPDTIFNEALVLEKARVMARDFGVEFLGERVKLIPTENGSFLIETDNEIFEAQFTVLAAGAGLPILLEQLDIDHRIVVERTPLLRFNSAPLMKTPYFADKSLDPNASGVFVTQHTFDVSPPSHCLVAAVSQRHRLRKDELASRIVYQKEEDLIRAALAKYSIRPDRYSSGYRATAGHKVEVLNAEGKTTIDPFVEAPPRYENLIIAIPGKATLSYEVAERVLGSLKQKLDGRQLAKAAKASIATPSPSQPLGHKPLMHHDPAFDGKLDERTPDPSSEEGSEPKTI
jgi:glycine/D-amino acid oxidase-like deaminating enzyme